MPAIKRGEDAAIRGGGERQGQQAGAWGEREHAESESESETESGLRRKTESENRRGGGSEAWRGGKRESMREIGRRKRKVVAVSVDVGPSLPLPVLEQHDRRIALDVERREQRRLLCAVHFGDRDGEALRAVVEGRHLLVHGRQLLAVSAPGCIEFDEPVAMLCPVPV